MASAFTFAYVLSQLIVFAFVKFIYSDEISQGGKCDFINAALEFLDLTKADLKQNLRILSFFFKAWPDVSVIPTVCSHRLPVRCYYWGRVQVEEDFWTVHTYESINISPVSNSW